LLSAWIQADVGDVDERGLLVEEDRTAETRTLDFRSFGFVMHGGRSKRSHIHVRALGNAYHKERTNMEKNGRFSRQKIPPKQKTLGQ